MTGRTGDGILRTGDGQPMTAAGYTVDKQREHRIADLITAAWSWDLIAFSPLSRVDYYAHDRGRPRAIVEIKTSTHHRGQFPRQMISAEKLMDLHYAAHGFRLRPLLVIAWSDVIGWLNLDHVESLETRHMGRTGEPPELCALIPMNLFRPLSIRPE